MILLSFILVLYRRHLQSVAANVCALVAVTIAVGCGTTATAQQPGSFNGSTFQPATRQIKVISTKLRGFGIPIKVDPTDPQFIEVQLYVSKDAGKSWQFLDRKPTSAREFAFQSDGDGEYLFALKTLNVDGQLLPDGDVQPELKIVVDTSPPQLDFRIESDPAGRVACRWTAIDSHLNPKSLKIQYRSNADHPSEGWKTVPANFASNVNNGTWSDQIAWWPDTTDQQLEVNLQIADYAGNAVSLDRRVTVQKTAWRHKSSGSTLDDANNKPSNLICENGVCRLDRSAPKEERQVAAASPWHKAIKPLIETAPSSVASAPNHGSGSRNAAGGSMTKSPGPWNLKPASPPKTAVTAQPPRKPRKVIGSQAHYAAPPMPTGWTQADQQQLVMQQARPASPPAQPAPFSSASPQRSQTPDVISWNSEVVSRGAETHEFQGTTMAPSPTVPPLPLTPSAQSWHGGSSNASTMKTEGDMVVAQSSTNWPKNQWPGPEKTSVDPPTSQFAPSANVAGVGNERIATTKPQSLGRLRDYPKTPFPPVPEPSSNNRTTTPFRNSGFGQADADQSRSAPTSMSGQASDSNTQIISSKRFRLNYDIDAIDPSGVGQIDLWMTRDGGQSWELWGQDPDNVSPFPVEVQTEGMYGFRIVVRSVDGLAGRGPTRGDSADMWIQVDVTSPLTKITSVPYGRGREAGKLVINYSVNDANLSLRPNRLTWSRSPEGPWTLIEEGLRNEGRYLWSVDRNTPDRIFLRLESHDRAGNRGVHNLSQAIDVSGLVPRGTIYGVEPVGR